MNFIDDRTYYKVIKPDFLNKEGSYKQKKIPRIKEAVQACHVNINITEVVITVQGYVVQEPQS
jgi:hypothetical protein